MVEHYVKEGDRLIYQADTLFDPSDLGIGNTDYEDMVNQPPHYNQFGIECIEAIKASLGDEFPAYCKGNVIKYLWRYKYKNGLEDLKKAQVYLGWMIDYTEEYNN